MSDQRDRAFVRESVDSALSAVRGDPWLAQRIMQRERTGGIIVKKLPIGLIVAIVLLLLTVTAVAAALLTPREVVEQIIVPTAQSNERENFSYEELAELLRTLNENGITLDEGSTLMRAFNAGHGYWEGDTIREICLAAFGGDEGAWTLEQKHWYGEMMEAIGAWDENPYLLPGENDMTAAQARTLAARILQETYGVELPAESSDQWRIGEVFNRFYDYDENGEQYRRERWSFWYENRKTGHMDYEISFDRDGSRPDPWRAQYLEKISTTSWITVMDALEDREGVCTKWSVETWAEFGKLIQGTTPGSRNGWLYLCAGYRLPPDGAISPGKAMEIAREEMNLGDITGKIDENVICCTDRDKPIYKVCQRVIFKAEDLDRAGRYDAVWCLEMDCMTGEILGKREYAYGSDGDAMMMYAPFSILSSAPDSEPDGEKTAVNPGLPAYHDREAAAMEQYGANMYFWPLEVQAEVYGGSHTVPTQEEYDRALDIAKDAIAKQCGPDALDVLGDWQVGVMFVAYWDDESVGSRGRQLNWDFLFTTDPEYLSDGYRVQFIQYVYPDPDAESVRELTVEHANMGHG